MAMAVSGAAFCSRNFFWPCNSSIFSASEISGEVVFCVNPAICRSPVKDVPCHKGCAETWIATHARDERDRARLIRLYTPGKCGAR